MNYVYSIAAIIAGLYIAYTLRQRAKSDAVVGEIAVQPKAEEIKDDIDIAALTKEVQDAKINYISDAERVRLEFLAARRKSRQP